MRVSAARRLIQSGVLCALAMAGCAARSEIRQQSVAELYAQAVQSARVSDPSSQSCDALPSTMYSDIEMIDENGEILPSPTDNFHDSSGLSSEFVPIDLNCDAAETEVEPSSASSASIHSADGVVRAHVSAASYQAPASNVLISEIFEQTDVREAIQILASYNGDSVIIDDTVGGVTSAQITNETFEQALQKVLLPLGLEYAKSEGAFIIAPTDPDSPLYRYISDRTTYAPKYHKTSELTELLPKRMLSFYQASDARNLIVIDAPKSISDEIHRRLRELDKPVQQVELEAIVCVSSPDSGFRFGVDWNHIVKVDGLDSLNLGMSGLTFSGEGSPNSAQNAFSDFAVTSAFIKLLAQQGYVSIRAAPRVTTKDNEKATISIERETFFSLQPSNTNVLFRQDVQKVQAGISLDITPRVRGNRVSVEIGKAEVSEDIRTSETSSELVSSPYPIINRRVVTTKVDVNDGQTIVIGGLVQRQTVDRINKVPILGDIPLAGRLFKTVEKQEREAEVAIFISPRIKPLEICE